MLCWLLAARWALAAPPVSLVSHSSLCSRSCSLAAHLVHELARVVRLHALVPGDLVLELLGRHRGVEVSKAVQSGTDSGRALSLCRGGFYVTGTWRHVTGVIQTGYLAGRRGTRSGPFEGREGAEGRERSRAGRGGRGGRGGARWLRRSPWPGACSWPSPGARAGVSVTVTQESDLVSSV